MWLLELPCRYGVVYPHGGELLAAAITSRRMGHRVAALPYIRSSRGDEERVVTFYVDDAFRHHRPCRRARSTSPSTALE
jgi:hypothetical protein